MTDNTTIQLRSLAVENRQLADFFDLAANLNETGYKSDQILIDANTQAIQDAVAAKITVLQQTLDDANAKMADIQAQLDAANSTIATLQAQLNSSGISKP